MFRFLSQNVCAFLAGVYLRQLHSAQLDLQNLSDLSENARCLQVNNNISIINWDV